MLKQTGYSREAPLLPAILRFSIPLMLTGILQLAYNTADSIIVGRYSGGRRFHYLYYFSHHHAVQWCLHRRELHGRPGLRRPG